MPPRMSGCPGAQAQIPSTHIVEKHSTLEAQAVPGSFTQLQESTFANATEPVGQRDGQLPHPAAAINQDARSRQRTRSRWYLRVARPNASINAC